MSSDILSRQHTLVYIALGALFLPDVIQLVCIRYPEEGLEKIPEIKFHQCQCCLKISVTIGVMNTCQRYGQNKSENALTP